MPKILMWIVALVFAGNHCVAQTFTIGPELGFTFMGVPRKNSITSGQTQRTTDRQPIPGWLAGFHSQLKIRTYFLFTFGAQYAVTGERLRIRETGHVPSRPGVNSYTYVTTTDQEQLLHKLSFPVALGFTFRLGKVQPAVQLGFRFNTFLSGSSRYSMRREATDHTQNRYLEQSYDPTDETQAYIPVPQVNQAMIGISAIVGPHLRISLNYFQGADFYHAQKNQPPQETHYIYFPQREFNLSVTWLLLNQ